MRPVIVGAALAGCMVASAAAQDAGDGLDREECIELLARTEVARDLADDLADRAQRDFSDAYGPVPVESDPGQPLVDATTGAWEAFAAALDDLCRDEF